MDSGLFLNSGHCVGRTSHWIWIRRSVGCQPLRKRAKPRRPQPRELAWMGFSLGLILGFIAGFPLFKGMHCLVEGIELFRGDRINELLLRYHDAIMTMMQSERAESANAANGEQPEGPISLDRRSG